MGFFFQFIWSRSCFANVMSVVESSHADCSDEAASCACWNPSHAEEGTAMEVAGSLQQYHPQRFLEVSDDVQEGKLEENEKEDDPKPLFKDLSLAWTNDTRTVSEASPWTEEKHRLYLNSIEEAFVRSLHGQGYYCSCRKRWQLNSKSNHLGAESKFLGRHCHNTKPQKLRKRYKTEDENEEKVLDPLLRISARAPQDRKESRDGPGSSRQALYKHPYDRDHREQVVSSVHIDEQQGHHLSSSSSSSSPSSAESSAPTNKWHP